MSIIYLQLALDRLSLPECFNILERVHPYVDWIEIGTGVIKAEGVSSIAKIKNRYPEKTIVADMKTVDAGFSETLLALDAGADVSTVMALAGDETIRQSLEAARINGKRILVDLLEIYDKKRFKDLLRLGTNFVGVHIGKDLQSLQHGITSGKMAAELGNQIQFARDLSMPFAVAGGITEETLTNVLLHHPQVVIVGSSITRANDPEAAAAKIFKMIREAV